MFHLFARLIKSWQHIHNVVVWDAAESVVGARLGIAMPLEDFERHPILRFLLQCVPVDLSHPLGN